MASERPDRPDRTTLSDGELVRLIRGGEVDAFAELMRRTQRAAYRLARRITRRHEDADDVVQDAYVKAFRALDRFESDRPFGPWFLTIVSRTALTRIRDGARRAAESLDAPGYDGGAPLSERVADPGQDAEALERRLPSLPWLVRTLVFQQLRSGQRADRRDQCSRQRIPGRHEQRRVIRAMRRVERRRQPRRQHAGDGAGHRRP